MKKRVLVDISAHGFGHVSQTAPVVNALFRRHRDIQLTVRSGLPGRFLESRIACPFEHLGECTDFGMLMKNAVEVDGQATASKYQAFHANWRERVKEEAQRLAAFDLVFCNVSYLPLKAAELAGIPAAALCSLNWADLYRHYCGGFPGSEAVHQEIADAYRSAGAFLRIEPGMPMDWLGATQIGPVASVGKKRRDEIRKSLGLKRHERIGLVSMGGMSYPIPFGKWPAMAGMHWLVPENVDRPDMTPMETLGMPFADLLASCDVLVTKPGYGSFVEAALSGIPVLYLTRRDWPEEPCLVDWLKTNGRCLEVGREAMERGEISASVAMLLAMPEKPAPSASGIEEAADCLESFLT